VEAEIEYKSDRIASARVHAPAARDSPADEDQFLRHVSDICKPEAHDEVAEVTQRYVALTLQAAQQARAQEETLKEYALKLQEADERARELQQSHRVLAVNHQVPSEGVR
jgi:hypothetical protein